MSELIDAHLTDFAMLVRVIESGGFTAAARATKVPQPTISRHIQQLEARLGLRLLDRTTRRVTLTEAGRRVFDHARAMLDQAEAVQAEIATLQAEPSGRLRVVAPVILGQALVTDILARFMADHPKIAVELEWATRVVSPIEDGTDIVLRIGRPPDSPAILTRMGTTQVRIFAPPGVDATVVRQPLDLAGLRIAGLGRELDDMTLTLRSQDRTETVSVPRTIVANDVQPVIAVARSTGALAILPGFAAPDGWAICLPDWSLPDLEINALSAPFRGSLPKTRLLLDALKLGIEARCRIS